MTNSTKFPIQLGEPVEHRGVVIAPLFPRADPRAEYLTLEQAAPLGFHVTEIDAAGSVPELLAKNPLDSNVLLYDGEELVGAKQNRILNVTALVSARSETKIPVSCVEEGRWSARSAHFAPSAHTAYPELRRRKAQILSAAPLERGLAQSAVWEEVASKAQRMGVQSPTRAQADIYNERPIRDDMRSAFPLVPGQSGALLALGDRICLDYVSRPDAFVRLYPKLLRGYLLDAAEHAGGKGVRLDEFLAAVAEAPRSRQASAGLGEDVRLAADRLVGSGLEVEGELIQLCAFSSEPRVAETRIAQPSSRF
jgi:ARG and Rhodanese-Phosphatase-superfamily-associated Protein domain